MRRISRNFSFLQKIIFERNSKILPKSYNLLLHHHHNNIINHHYSYRNYSSKESEIFAKFKCLTEIDLFKIQKSEIKKEIDLSLTECLELLKKMIYIRKFEEKANSLYKSRKIRGFCHLSIGQEASNVGLLNELQLDKDVICQSYRMHGIAYLCGISIESIIGELCGKKCGSSKAKGGSMHFYRKDNLYGGYGIVGSQIPIASGVAFAMKYNNYQNNENDDRNPIAVGIYGDGAANQGQLYEAYNLAKLHDLPLILVCENNQYAMGTSISRASSISQSFHDRFSTICGIKLDGQDLISVICGSKFAAKHCRSGKGPIFLELETYRFVGHSMSDPGLSYRTRDEIKKKKQNSDPIKLFSQTICEEFKDYLSNSKIEKIEEEIEEEIEEISRKVLEEKDFPEIHEVCDEIYSNNSADFLPQTRGRDPLEILTHK